ncbi:MAG: hypothetical protein WCP03_01260 [Candidatus Saccharibacteria bacterium]
MYIYKLKTKMPYKEKISPNQSNEYQPTTKTAEFYATQQKGLAIAERILTKRPEASLSDIEKFLINNKCEKDVIRATLLYCCIPEIATLVNRGKTIDSDKKVPGVDYDKVVRFNQCLKGVIKDSSDTSMSPQCLIAEMLNFGTAHGYVTKGHSESFHKELNTAFVGMWNEQGVENLMQTAGIDTISTSIQQDRKGIDLFAETKHKANPVESEWTAIDIKSSVHGILRITNKGDSSLKKEDIFCVQDARLSKYDSSESLVASRERPVIYVIIDQEKALIAVDVGKKQQLPDDLAAPKYTHENVSAMQSVFRLRAFLDESSCRKRTRENNNFEPAKTPQKIGSVAINLS